MADRPIFAVDPETQRIADIRDQLLRWLRDHRAHCTDGRCAEPANALAFLAHSLGLKHDRLDALQREMIKYEENCPDCPHLRN